MRRWPNRLPVRCRGLDESNVRPGDTSRRDGSRPIGLMFVAWRSLAYGARVIAIARRMEQVDRAMLLGAERAS